MSIRVGCLMVGEANFREQSLRNKNDHYLMKIEQRPFSPVLSLQIQHEKRKLMFGCLIKLLTKCIQNILVNLDKENGSD